jgi:hypothetical protein
MKTALTWETAAMGRGKSLYEVVFRMTNYGVDSHVTRSRWLRFPGTHVRVTGVVPNPRVRRCAGRLRSGAMG